MNYIQEIQGRNIFSWETFYQEFQSKMGFFDGYGQNGNAWIDCMTDMYTNGEYQSLTKYNLKNGDSFTLKILNVDVWAQNSPETFDAFKDWCTASNRDELHFNVEYS